MRVKIVFLCIYFSVNCFSQQLSNQYDSLVAEGFKFYELKDYKNAILNYQRAIKLSNGLMMSNHRYDLACAYSRNSEIDSAFVELFKIARKAGMSNIDHLRTDRDLTILHSDERWNVLCEIVIKNKSEKEKNYNGALQAELEEIGDKDQTIRTMINDSMLVYGFNSSVVKKLILQIEVIDSINLNKTNRIIDQYGWVGKDFVGEKAAKALFLVIQHSDTLHQIKYLPLLRKAVEEKKADGYQLALMVDRIAMSRNQKQIYGSQVYLDSTSKAYRVWEIDNPSKVNQRREKLGIGNLENYLRQYNIDWK